MKIILKRNKIIKEDKELILFIYNQNYNYLSLIEESELHFLEDDENYHINDDFTRISEKTFNRLNWTKVYSKKTLLKLDTSGLVASYFYDQNSARFYRKENLLFPSFKFYKSIGVEEYKSFPRLHITSCGSLSAHSRTTNTNSFVHNIVDSDTEKIFPNVELEICKICEPDLEKRKLLRSGLYYDSSEFFDKINKQF